MLKVAHLYGDFRTPARRILQIQAALQPSINVFDCLVISNRDNLNAGGTSFVLQWFRQLRRPCPERVRYPALADNGRR